MPITAASQVLTTEVLNARDVTTIIGNINGLYTNVFTFIAIFMTVIGVVMPTLIAYFQKKKLKNDEKALVERISTEIEKEKKHLSEDIRNQISSELNSLEQKISALRTELTSEINNKFNIAEAKAHHAQALRSMEQKLYAQACADCLYAGIGYAKSRSEGNLGRVLDVLIKSVLQNMQKPDFAPENGIENKLENLLEAVEPLNETGGYDDQIKAIKKGIADAKIRIKT